MISPTGIVPTGLHHPVTSYTTRGQCQTMTLHSAKDNSTAAARDTKPKTMTKHASRRRSKTSRVKPTKTRRGQTRIQGTTRLKIDNSDADEENAMQNIRFYLSEIIQLQKISIFV